MNEMAYAVGIMVFLTGIFDDVINDAINIDTKMKEVYNNNNFAIGIYGR